MKIIYREAVTSSLKADGSPDSLSTTESISEPTPRRLAELEESHGQLLRVREMEGFCIAVFAWGAISLPVDLRGRLRELVGKKIGILRLEGYHIRELG